MDDNFGEWVESMGIATHYFFPTPLVLALFWQQHPYFFVHLKNVFDLIM